MNPVRPAVIEPLPPGVPDALAKREAYPHDESAATDPRWVQTHISHVFLTGSRVYKLRKAVNLGFVDFSTRRERNADCLREITLNRRLAPDVYLGVAPLMCVSGRVQVGPVGETLAVPDATSDVPEHCVVMRRLADARDALSLLQRGELRRRHIDAVAERVAHFHGAMGLGVPAPFAPDRWLARIREPFEESLTALAAAAGRHVARPAAARLAERARGFLDRHADRFEARRRAGRAVDGHGDLHLQHVWFDDEHAEPLLIDCIEFREDLRRIDAAAEVAFLAMDLVYRRRRRLAERFLRRYARATDDFGLYGVIDFYVSYRAAVRAKVAVLSADDPALPATQREGARGSARRHLALALRALAPRPAGGVILMAGVVGTGKSTVAEVLSDELGGAVIASDRLRKRLAGLEPTARAAAPAGRGLYTRERSDEVYAGLLARAEPVVASGRFAILDATFARAGRREAARRWARRQGVPLRIVETRCEARTALRRLARRQERGQDPSDAGPELYRNSVATFEALTEAGPGELRTVETEGPDWRGRVRRLAREMRVGN